MKRKKRGKLAVAWRVLVLLFKIVVSALVLSTPVAGVWVGSSLAAFSGGARWVPIVAGLVAFPVLPLGWDAFSEWRRKKKPPRERILTFGDRLLLRTFALNFTFLALLLAARPEAAFEALNARGDWMLEGRHGKVADGARRGLFKVAGSLQWLYKAAYKDPFKKLAPDDANPNLDGGKAGRLADRGSSPGSTGGTGAAPSHPAPSGSGSRGSAPDRQKPAKKAQAPAHAWPFAESVEPVVRDVPASAQGSVSGVAHYLRDHESDPFLRVKAIHDYVADHVAYDAEALADGRYPPQDAATVLHTHKAVCAGYAKLFVALARAAGVHAAYLTGNARTGDKSLDGLGHAWNAVEIDKRWYLLDATWDAGSVDGRRFTKHYRSDYFLTPPDVFGIDHFPSKARWQLREHPISHGEFLRQPMMSPSFFARGMKLEHPRRSQVDVSGAFDALIDNPLGQFLMATSEPEDGGPKQKCNVVPGHELGVHCLLSAPGVYRVRLFASAKQYNAMYDQVGALEAVER